MNNLSMISADACLTFAKNELKGFFDGCRDYYNQLLKLGDESGVPIISAIHQKIEKIVRQSGGIYKPSGAGNGDFGIAMTDDKDKAGFIKSAIEKKGFITVDLNTSHVGVHVGG
jgi:phosphomevalonate kinase